MNLIKELERRSAFLSKTIRSLSAFRFPEENIIVNSRNDGTFYHKTLGKKRIYLSKKTDKGIIEILVRKVYYSEVLASARKELKMVNELLKYERSQPLAVPFYKLPKEQQSIQNPVERSVEDRVELFRNLKFREKETRTGNYRVKTARGDYVRSRAEQLIADTLFEHNIPYQYEMPFRCHVEGIDLYPDFTIMDPVSGETVIWEHVGMLDNPNYVETFHNKMETYLLEGVFPGHGMILTFKTLVKSDVESIVEAYFE